MATAPLPTAQPASRSKDSIAWLGLVGPSHHRANAVRDAVSAGSLGESRVLLPSDTGFSLIEVVVAIVVLVAMSLGLLPLLIGSVKISAVNRDLVSASSYAHSRVSELRDAFPDAADTSCAAVTARETTNDVDPAGTGLKSDIGVASCPAVYPGVVTVTVVVRNSMSASSLVTLNTQIVVTQS